MSKMESIPEEGTPILVVDDDDGMLSSIEATLCSCGLPRPALLSDPLRAAPLIREHGFRVVLLDVLMPGANGMDVLEEVKSEFPDLYCIMVTAVDSVDKAVDAIQRGALDYLVKPIGRGRLRSVVRAALRLAAETGAGGGGLRIDEKRRYEGMLKRSVAETDALKSENAVLLEKMKTSKVLFEKVLDSIPWAILITDAEDRRIVEANQSAEGLFRYPRGAFIGNTPDFLHVEETAPDKFRKRLKAAVAENGAPEPRNFNMKKRDGTTFSSDYSMFPIENDDGHPIAHAHLIRDNTEQRRLEEQARETQKMAEIGALAFSIAHDFNNMLTPIMGYTEMVADGLPEGSDDLQLLGQVLTAANRAKELVEQILRFGREKSQEKESILIQYTIEEILTLLTQTLPPSVTIETSVRPCGAVSADPAQIHQLVMNLCVNAFHALPDRKGRIEIGLESVRAGEAEFPPGSPSAPGRYVKLTVGDSGCGIGPDALNKIFDPYFTTKPAGQGTGLGLSIVQGIARSHDGFIRVESEPGRGTAFHVYLPEIETDPSDETARPAKETGPFGGGKILIVDNDMQCKEILKQIVASFGYEPTATASPLDALEMVQRSPNAHDLLLTDLVMPQMDGLELSKNVTRIRPDMPVLLMTGCRDSLGEAEMAAAGITSWIDKPFSKAELGKVLTETLASRGTRGQ